MAQRFYANPRTAQTAPNGATSYSPGGHMDCIGPWAKVHACPIEGTQLRLTCYATGYADTAFSIPACTRYRGSYVSGFFTTREDGPVFVPHVRAWVALGLARVHCIGLTAALTLKHADYMRATCPDDLRELLGLYYVQSQLQNMPIGERAAYLGATPWPESHYPYAENLQILASVCEKMRASAGGAL